MILFLNKNIKYKVKNFKFIQYLKSFAYDFNGLNNDFFEINLLPKVIFNALYNYFFYMYLNI